MSKLDEAIAQFPVASWISEHTKVKDKGGRNFYAQCPFCGGENRLGIDRDRKIFHCFRCNEGGHGGQVWNGRAGLVKMVMMLESLTFKQAAGFISKRAGYPDAPFQAKEIIKELVPKEAHPLKGLDASDPALKFMQKRSIAHLIPSTHVCYSGKYQDRVILKAKFLEEEIGFEAKSIYGRDPKSLFPEWLDTYSNVYSTQFNFGYEFCFITESIVDAETYGTNALGCFGGYKEGQLAKLVELRNKGIKRLIWCMDWDAWRKQTKSILNSTLGLFENYVANIPVGQDPNSLGRELAWTTALDAAKIRDEFDLVQITLKFGREL